MDSIPDEFLFLLIVGSYGFIVAVIKWAVDRFDKMENRIEGFETNHLRHVKRRLDRLEKLAGVDVDPGLDED